VVRETLVVVIGLANASAVAALPHDFAARVIVFANSPDLTLARLNTAPHIPMRPIELLGMIGTQDLMLFLPLLLLFCGAKKMPELARSMGKVMGEFKKARDEFEREITHAVNQGEAVARVHDPVEPIAVAGAPAHADPRES